MKNLSNKYTTYFNPCQIKGRNLPALTSTLQDEVLRVAAGSGYCYVDFIPVVYCLCYHFGNYLSVIT